MTNKPSWFLIAPTLLAMAGQKATPTMQGINLLDQLSGKIPERKAFFYEHTYLGSPAIPKVEGIVTPDFKYMQYTEHAYEELFNTKKDPHETHNLAADPKYRKKLSELRAAYQKSKQQVL